MAELTTSQVYGDLTVTGLTKSSVLQSLIGTGTAPFIVSSTTLVNNLNSDLLDGFHGDSNATKNTYALRGSALANLQVVGLSTSWGLTSGVDTGGINVVMGTGASATWLISGTNTGVYIGGVQLLDSGTSIRLYALTGYLDVTSAGLVTSSGGFSGALTGNASTATTFQTARTIGISGDGTGTATSFNGSANITIPFTLANVATAGTYRSVTINAKGLVTAGTNPTTLSGYGITDATPSSHIGSSGTAHAVATTSVAGFMSATDKTNLDKVPLLGQGLRNSFLCDGGELRWGMTANVFSWSKAYNIYPAQGTLLLNGLPFKKLTIAASSVTLSAAGQCAYITVPTSYSDATNLVGTCTMAVADATTVSGTDKIILYVRDADSCLQGWDGWIVYGTIVQAGGKRDAYVENLFTAANDFVLGSGSRTFVKKTLAETRAILGATANTASTLVLRDASGGFNAGAISVGSLSTSGTITATGAVNANGGLAQDGQVILNGSDTWLRTHGATGWFNETYGGGIHMMDSSWVRVYNGKGLCNTNEIRSEYGFSNIGRTGSNANNARNHFTGINAGSAAMTTGWIAAAFGDTSCNRVVIGQASGKAILGVHNADLTAYANLHLNTDGGTVVVGLPSLTADSRTEKFQVFGDTFVSGDVTANAFRTANAQGIYIGDDAKIFDVGVSNTIGVHGQQNPAEGYIIFGNADTTSKLGRTGSGELTYAGNRVLTHGYFVSSNTNNSISLDVNINSIGYVTGISLLEQSDGALYTQAHSSSWQHQIYGDYRTGQITIRGKNNNTWQGWRTVLDSGNYNSYAPTKTGTGASGTWTISITGNAATATKFSTARTINGVSFDGTANITVADSTKLPLTGGSLSGSLSVAGAGIGISNTDPVTGYGLSLYYGVYSGIPDYGIAFAGTATFGTHGYVTGDWATYFTMAGDIARGWIFRHKTEGNVASIDAYGDASFRTVKTNELSLTDGSSPQYNYGFIGSPAGSSLDFTIPEVVNQTYNFKFGSFNALSLKMTAASYSGLTLNGNITTNRIFPSPNVSSSAYSEAAIEVRELNKAGAQSGSWSEAPRISFHWSGRAASQIAMNTSGTICLRNNPGTDYAALECASVYASGNITAYSDPRLKRITSKLKNPIEKLNQLTAYYYERLDLNNKKEIGLLTSDVKKVLPELVCTLKVEKTELISDGILETLDYSKLTALLVEVCKEQQKRIEILEKKVI